MTPAIRDSPEIHRLCSPQQSAKKMFCFGIGGRSLLIVHCPIMFYHTNNCGREEHLAISIGCSRAMANKEGLTDKHILAEMGPRAAPPLFLTVREGYSSSSSSSWQPSGGVFPVRRNLQRVFLQRFAPYRSKKSSSDFVRRRGSERKNENTAPTTPAEVALLSADVHPSIRNCYPYHTNHTFCFRFGRHLVSLPTAANRCHHCCPFPAGKPFGSAILRHLKI